MKILISSFTSAALIMLNVLEDAYDYIDEKFREAVADGIVTMIQNILDLISGGLSPNSGTLSPDGSSYIPDPNGFFNVVKEFILVHPKTYGTNWKNIQDISETFVLPIATTFIAIIAVYDLYQMVVVHNSMHDFDSSFFIRWVIKTHIALNLTSHSFTITEWIFHLGGDIAYELVGGTGNWISSLADSAVVASELKENLMKYDVGRLVLVWLLSVITLVTVFLMFAAIVMGLLSRLIEMYMYMSIAPIPIATLMNNETKGIGDSWIRGALGLSFQVFFIIIALTIFGSVFQTTINSIADGQHIVWDFVKLAAFSITLIMTILRSGQISKGMFGAH